ncbi:5-formyltetrahydrofolate cyclo-ligase [Aquibacillus halophilus]|uniref:5-formyltetrahydrofolate cyclo-ligase n=1 Tax=Aquibacillus halophilus TaxID=930132 RepID=A0A6A8DPC6_9BACI|nr:5-formyltetrahydrofolate cyclo-ligase [Aquibacillus halophilus]MRH43122.1 5-formyltetrahydrofolate cyclo-ligase [Aquibacillus halophilus]
MKKSELRKQSLEYVKSLSSVDKLSTEFKLEKYLFQTPYWKEATSIGITMSRKHEWNTTTIIETGWSEGKKISVPKCYPDTSQLIFYQLDTYNQLESVYFNLLEPNPAQSVEIHKNEIDLIIVPGLLFDHQGYRIGFGGGYYDRYLSDFNGVTISLASDQQVLSALPYDRYDIQVQHLITESGVLF